jgi:hypothetical protein
MNTRYVMRRDTQGWRVQVWVAFCIALIACGWGVLAMPGANLDAAFLALGLVFSLFSTLAVAKMTRDNRDGQVDTQGWVVAVWVAFAAAIAITAWGMWRMNIDAWQKGYMLVSWLFLISSSFAVAKMVRDEQEAELMARQAQAQREAAADPAAQRRVP